MNLRFMRLIADLVNLNDTNGARKLVKVDPTLHLLVSVLTILLCAISGNAFFTVSVIAVELLRTALMSTESIRRVLGKTICPVIFTALIMIPSVFLGSPGTFGTVTMKVFESVLILSLLNEDITWNEMTGALSRLFAPELFILTLDTAVRFLVLLGRYSDRLLEAVKLRRVGRKNWKNAGTGGVLGVTWLKSQQMLSANTEAMTCRCFDGTYRKNFQFQEETAATKKKRRMVNIFYSLLIPFVTAGFIYTQAVM